MTWSTTTFVRLVLSVRRSARHLDEFRAAMADPNAAINVLAGKVPSNEQIEALIRPIH